MLDVLVKIKKLTDKATMPTKGSSGAACFDLYAATDADIEVWPGDTMPFYTDLAFEIPYGYVGLIFSRSGISTKRGLRIATGVSVIDSDYRGNVGIPLHNDSEDIQTVTRRERIAQMMIIPFPQVVLYESIGDLSYTQRGCGGFGSTGR